MIHIHWIDRGGKATQPPDPDYPYGIDVDLTGGRTPFCETALPYPAKRLGYFTVACDLCGFTAM
ncbi:MULTISPECIES: hypothetical protein [unclassified Bradyrhizobium]|uniref:hypothetical protein n=1 Tax=unclassified Bradyrhizobium TaxID=2631580 RepID=UPI001BD19282|nr:MULTISPECIES: hypothetical protein [unclassified Bradyrhizobium]WOH52776.1 hypothetical protein RX328_12075 [Bradyrhizobium sp. sBnM-33]